MATDSSSPSSSASSPSSTSSTASTLTTHNTNNNDTAVIDISTNSDVLTRSAHAADTALQNGEVRSRSISAPASRSSSFSENLDRLAFISQSAHTFPANLTPFSSSSRDSSSSISSHSAAVRSARSTPNSPRLAPVSTPHHERRAISRPTSPSFSRRGSGTSSPAILAPDHIRVRRRRARSWVNTPGAGFTPASTPPISRGGRLPPEGMSTVPPPQRASQRHASSPETNFDALQAQSDLYARARCSSSSGSSFTNNSLQGEERPARSRQYSFSARVSPVLSPLQPMTPVEVVLPPPHRTHSVPHMARISPMIYGYSYHYGAPIDGQEISQAGRLDGYFAIPHTNGALTSNISPLGGDEMPPPYTASQIDLHNMSGNYGNEAQADRVQDRAMVARDDNDEEEEGAAVLSFSTSRRQFADQLSESESELRQRRRRAEEEEEEAEARERRDHVEMPSLPKSESPTLQFSQVRLFVLLYILHPLRLIAALPGCIGTFWLLRNALLLLWREGTVLRKGGKDGWGEPSALEFGLASLWSLATAYHALSFTTLLLRRWLHYYSILPSFIRLIALQAICWPLVRMTLFVLGPKNPLASWVIISTTTAFSDTVARWVVSNITDEIHTPPEVASSITSTNALRSRKKRRRKTAMAFWRAVMGGPPAGAAENDPYSSRTHLQHRHRNFATTTESEAESDVDFYRHNRRSLASGRLPPGGTQSDLTSGGEEEGEGRTTMMTSPTNGLIINGMNTDPSSSDQRVGRFFHWDVALRRNVLPIALLAYLSLGAMLVEQSVQRAIKN